jgi:hypothetical protein
MSELFKLEDKCQWPVLQRIDNPSSYQGSRQAVLNRFIKIKEKALREAKDKTDKAKYGRLRSI